MSKRLIKKKLDLLLIRVFIINLIFIGLTNPAYSKQKQVPLHFDFGAIKSKVKSSAILVTEKMLYNKKNGFGLVESADQAFLLSDKSLKDEITIDGIRSKSAIKFRVDLPAGKYWIEIFMAGGNRSLWVGEIMVNKVLLADSLFQYGVSFEDEDPPVYWSLLRKVEVKKNSMIISIFSHNQISTLTGISIYKADVGPIILKDGQLIVVGKLKAPNAQLAIDLLNRGAPAEAQRISDQIPETKFRYEKALLLLACAGRLEVNDPRVYIELAKKMLEQEYIYNKRSEVAFNLRLAQLYSEGDTNYKMGGWDWASRHSGRGIFDRQNMSGHKMKKISEVKDHSLNHRAVWYTGKLSFWAWVEQHNRWQKNRADKCFEYLKPFYPDYRLLRIYSGEQILPDKVKNSHHENNFPDWVNETNLALNSLREVIHYWVNFRQAENGEFGGKYDDDVEMLRWWPIARLAQNDSLTLVGLRRLVNGVWNSGWITNGFSTKVRDVEHSSEPVADTQPMMIGLDYGNPIYVERCMESIKGLRDVWTGINKKGHRHFKSSWYSYNQIDTTAPKDCDVEMNARTVKAARWLAWYNHHPFAMQFMKEWCDAWLEDCLRTDKGKPYGIVPAAIRYEDDAIGGHANNWHHPGMFWRYYNFTGGNKMMRQFLTMFILTGENKYLQPIEEAVKLVKKYEDKNTENAEIGSEVWVAGILKKSPNFAKTMEIWRLLTNETSYDELMTKFGSDYLKFRLTGDKKYLYQGSKKVTDGILYNRELITTEGYFTDRIEIGNVNESKVLGSSHLESLYLGGALYEGFYPFYSVSWDALGENFVAVVLESSSKQLKILISNLTEKVKNGSVNFWNLEPGDYEFIQGPDTDENDEINKIERKNNFTVLAQSTSHSLTLPAKSSQVIEVRQLKSTKKTIPVGLPDLAITKSEVQLSEKQTQIQIKIPVHNIGIADVFDVNVELIIKQNGTNISLAKQRINIIEAPLDLEPRIVIVEFLVNESQISNGEFTIVIDPENKIQEITETNNQIVVNRNPMKGK